MSKNIEETLQNIYPVGSIYMSVNAVNPSNFFGGTWEQIKDTFLLSAGDIYQAGSMGGEATHTLTIDEMPSHKHRASENFNVALGIQQGDWNIDYQMISSNGFYKSNDDFADRWQNTAAAGGGQPHNNMPPYLAVYVWKRIA